MSYSVFLHPDVEKYLDSLSESEKEAIKSSVLKIQAILRKLFYRAD